MKVIILFLTLFFSFLSTAGETNVVSLTKLKLLSDIKKQEDKIYDLTNGVPKMYIINSDGLNDFMSKKIRSIWAEYDVAITNLNKKKLEFRKTL